MLDNFRAASIPKLPSICWRRVTDGEKLLDLDLSVVEDHPDRMTILQLGKIMIMYRHCMEKGKGLIEVLFDNKLIHAEQDEDTAWVDVEVGEEGQQKETKRYDADYVIGCDGATSTIRRSLFGRHWPGQTFPYKFIVQNVNDFLPEIRAFKPLTSSRSSTMASKSTGGTEGTT